MGFVPTDALGASGSGACPATYCCGYRYGWSTSIWKSSLTELTTTFVGQIARRVHDKRLLRLIRSWLKAGALENGLVGPTEEGTPQGGPVSPLLSNLVLDQLDRELEQKGASIRSVRGRLPTPMSATVEQADA